MILPGKKEVQFSSITIEMFRRVPIPVQAADPVRCKKWEWSLIRQSTEFAFSTGIVVEM
jgi:hypothetical protein